MRKFLKALPFALALGGFAAPPVHAEDGVIRIGATLRMISEEGERIGQMLLDSFDEVNKAGGINGRQVQVVLTNDECKSDKGVANAIKLVSEFRAHLIIGSTCSSVTLPIVDIASRAKVPQISPSSTGADITKKGSEWIFRVPISERFYNAVVGRFIADDVGTRVAYLYTPDNASMSFASTMIEFMRANYGVEPVYEAQTNEQEVDFRSFLLRIKEANPDAIAFAGVPADMAKMITQANEVGIPASVVRVASSNASVPAMPELAGDNAIGLIFAAAFSSSDPRPEVQSFVAETTERYGVSRPGHDFSQAWDMVQIIKQALEESELELTAASLAADREAIRDALAAITDYHGLAAGPISFCPEPTQQCRDGNRSPMLLEYSKGGKDFETTVRAIVNFEPDFGL